MSVIQKLLKENDHVHIHDSKRTQVEGIVHALIDDGQNKLQIVADFDFTMTMFEKDGVHLPSTFAVIEADEQVTLPDGSSLHKKSEELRSKYRPMETDIHMDVSEKLPHMIDWWREAERLYVESSLNQNLIRDLVRTSSLELKAGVHDFVADLLRSETPILIFSAGLGDVIEIFLEKEIPEFKNNQRSSHIVSNFIKYDQDGKLLSFRDKLIHSFNKNEQEIHETPYYQSIHNRPNVILLGDSAGDVHMIAGMKNLSHVLKIGYLNHSTPEKLDVYTNVYDIVICDDQTFNIPNVVLKAILK